MSETTQKKYINTKKDTDFLNRYVKQENNVFHTGANDVVSKFDENVAINYYDSIFSEMDLHIDTTTGDTTGGVDEGAKELDCLPKYYYKYPGSIEKIPNLYTYTTNFNKYDIRKGYNYNDVKYDETKLNKFVNKFNKFGFRFCTDKFKTSSGIKLNKFEYEPYSKFIKTLVLSVEELENLTTGSTTELSRVCNLLEYCAIINYIDANTLDFVRDFFVKFLKIGVFDESEYEGIMNKIENKNFERGEFLNILAGKNIMSTSTDYGDWLKELSNYDIYNLYNNVEIKDEDFNKKKIDAYIKDIFGGSKTDIEDLSPYEKCDLEILKWCFVIQYYVKVIGTKVDEPFFYEMGVKYFLNRGELSEVANKIIENFGDVKKENINLKNNYFFEYLEKTHIGEMLSPYYYHNKYITLYNNTTNVDIIHRVKYYNNILNIVKDTGITYEDLTKINISIKDYNDNYTTLCLSNKCNKKYSSKKIKELPIMEEYGSLLILDDFINFISGEIKHTLELGNKAILFTRDNSFDLCDRFFAWKGTEYISKVNDYIRNKEYQCLIKNLNYKFNDFTYPAVIFKDNVNESDIANCINDFLKKYRLVIDYDESTNKYFVSYVVDDESYPTNHQQLVCYYTYVSGNTTKFSNDFMEIVVDYNKTDIQMDGSVLFYFHFDVDKDMNAMSVIIKYFIPIGYVETINNYLPFINEYGQLVNNRRDGSYVYVSTENIFNLETDYFTTPRVKIGGQFIPNTLNEIRKLIVYTDNEKLNEDSKILFFTYYNNNKYNIFRCDTLNFEDLYDSLKKYYSNTENSDNLYIDYTVFGHVFSINKYDCAYVYLNNYDINLYSDINIKDDKSNTISLSLRYYDKKYNVVQKYDFKQYELYRLLGIHNNIPGSDRNVIYAPDYGNIHFNFIIGEDIKDKYTFSNSVVELQPYIVGYVRDKDSINLSNQTNLICFDVAELDNYRICYQIIYNLF